MTTQRLRILNPDEVDEIYKRPHFTDVERRHFFILSEDAKSLLKLKPINHDKTSSKLYFILQYGYFKAKYLFFHFQYNQIKEDVVFIMENYFPHDTTPLKLPTEKQQIKTKKLLLNLFGFSNNTQKTNQLIMHKVLLAVQSTQNPIDIFQETVRFLNTHKMALPPYSRLQDKIGEALTQEASRLIKLVKLHLPIHIEEAIQKLLQMDNAFYTITELKFDAQSFRKQEMQAELNKLALCQPIYQFFSLLLPHLTLSRKNIEHYAGLAKSYTVYRLKRLPKQLVYLYLMCYIYERTEKITNNLIQAFIYHVDKEMNEAKKHAVSIAPIIEPLVEENIQAMGKLIQLYTDDEVMALHGSKIQEKAYDILPKADILNLSQTLLKEKESAIQKENRLIFEYYKNNHQRIVINLRPLFKAITFESKNELNDLMEAIHFLKNIFLHDKKLADLPLINIPIKHIHSRKILTLMTEIKIIGDKSIQTYNIYQYEFYLYKAIRENYKKYKLFCSQSTEYKHFDDDIKPPYWQQNKIQRLQELNNSVLLNPIEDTLNQLENKLEPLIQRVNERALNGENKHIKIVTKRDGTTHWAIPYPKKNTETDNPFYDKIEPITISELIDFVEQKTGFIRKFTHIKPHYAKSKGDYIGVKGVLLANATAQGTYQFAKRSNLKYQYLQTIEQNYFRLTTLREAADVIINAMLALPIFENYHIDNKKHGSIDGKKIKTRRRLLRARHSPKYFGLDIGLVVMTMNLNQIPFVTQIIGANEHESHYTYSMLLRNTSLIDPDIISTDTAGTNNLNDLLYFMLGKIHAPCYRSTVDKANTICGFKPLKQYEHLLIKPTKIVNKSSIITNWPDIQTILAALLSHETKQSIIVKKLSSHDYKNPLKDATWEFNHILKSIHILKYIDDPNYRRYIRTALNRGEAYHQLLDKITAVGGNDFRGMSELEVEIWNECTRLTALVIIYYNMYVLSKLYEIKLAEGDLAAIEYLKHISPIATQHINMGGLYQFNNTMIYINIDKIVDDLHKILDAALKI